MAVRKTPSAGSKPDKLIRDALIIALKRNADDGSGKKLQQMADKMVDKAIEGDVSCMREVGDRVDGKAPQDTKLTHVPSNGVAELLEWVNGRNSGLPNKRVE